MDYTRLFLLYPTEILVLLALAFCFTKYRIRPALLWAVGILGSVVYVYFAFHNALYNPIEHLNNDGQIFWEAGQFVLAGDNPYKDFRVLNPPTAPLLYAALGIVPATAFVWVWLAFNTVGYLLLTPFAQVGQTTPKEDNSWQLPWAVIAVLAPAVALSYAARYGQELGQFSVIITLALIMAVWAHGRDRPNIAGLGLAIGTIKIGTMLPFLLLLHRKKDWKTWVAMFVIGCLLVFAFTPPWELLERCQMCLKNIAGMRSEGMDNDFSYVNNNNIEIIGFDHVAYRLGIRERWAVRIAEYGGTLLLGVLVGWQVIVRGFATRAAAVAMVAFYAAVFLYHRHYDHVILVLPLVYTMGRARTTSGWVRFFYTLSAFSGLGVIYLRVGILRRLTVWVLENDGVLSRVVEVVILPHGTYLVLIGMLCLWAAERLREPVSPPHSTPEPHPGVATP